MRRFERLGINRLGIFWVLALFVGAACTGPEKEHAEEHDHEGESGQVVTVAHKHEKAGETCFICDPAKRDKGRLWCNEHARYEDRCWLCHPELEDTARLYCKEHSLYEDECFLCHPELKAKPSSGMEGESSPVAAESAAPELFCNEHGVPEMECGICQPQLASGLQPGKSLFVRMPSQASAEKAGIRTGFPLRKEHEPGLEVLCEAQYNKNMMTKVTPLTNGIVQRVFADVGDRVAAGDVLVELHSAEVASAKSAYLSALVALDIKKETRDREKRLLAESISAEKEYLEAEANFRLARLEANHTRQKLLNLGLQAEAIGEIEQNEDSSAILQIRAPFQGTLIDRAAVPGQAISSGEALFVLADLSTRWLVLSIPSDRLADVRVGQHVEARFGELPGEVVAGKIVWIDTAVDERTRLVHARVLATRGIDRIRASMFGQAKILTRSARSGVSVPRDAVQHHERQPFVFVRQEADLYALRRVSLGDASGNTVEVLEGLNPNEAVVTDSGFLVMSEFLKSRLGAGCTDH